MDGPYVGSVNVTRANDEFSVAGTSYVVNRREEPADEWRAGAGGDAQGCVRPDGRRQAQGLEGRRAALGRLGDVPPERVARRSEPHLRIAVDRLARAGHAALRRRRPEL